jgi:osmotically-inducible protein OsmY
MYQKDAAESAIAPLRGVRGVSNFIRIMTRPASAEVRTRIEQALERSAAVDASRVRVDVSNSMVSLSGEVQSRAARREVEQAAWSSPGVTRVENRLRVVS